MVSIPKGEVTKCFACSTDSDASQSYGASWFGSSYPLSRFINGYDVSQKEFLISKGVSLDIVTELEDSGILPFRFSFHCMEIQEAIDFANYCMQIVIGYNNFYGGARYCGGDVDICVITPKNLQWVQCKKWLL